MKVNGNTVTYGAANNENGADLVCNGGALSTQFSEIFANDDAWTYTENGLPILKVVKGEQSSELPSVDGSASASTMCTSTTAQQLKQLADEVNAGDSKSGKTVLLMNDIDLSGIPQLGRPSAHSIWNWSDVSRPFSGVFDGQNHDHQPQFDLYVGYERLCGIVWHTLDGTVQNADPSRCAD